MRGFDNLYKDFEDEFAENKDTQNGNEIDLDALAEKVTERMIERMGEQQNNSADGLNDDDENND